MRRSELARVRAMEAALRGQEQQLGPDDPRTVESRVRLVEAYEQLPDYDDEQRSWEERSAVEMATAVDSRTRTLGPDHPETLSAVLELAKLSDGERQRELRRRIVLGWERIAVARARRRGPLDPAALEARDEHLRFVDIFDGTDAGQRLCEALVGDYERALGADHPETVRAHIRLLDHSGMPGRESPPATAGAEELIERAYGILGAADEGVLRLRYLLLATHLMAGREESARAIARRYPSPSDDDFFIWAGPDT
jgi:hypothetical protein